MLKENVVLISWFIIAILFIIFMNIQGHYMVRLNSLLRAKYSKMHKKLILIDFGFALFIPRPIKIMKYIWLEKFYPKDIYPLIKKIRLFQKLGLLFFISAILVPFVIELVF